MLNYARTRKISIAVQNIIVYFWNSFKKTEIFFPAIVVLRLKSNHYTLYEITDNFVNREKNE